MPAKADQTVEIYVGGEPASDANPVPTAPAAGAGDTLVDQGAAGTERWLTLDNDVLVELQTILTKITDGSLRGTVIVGDGAGPLTVDGTVAVTAADGSSAALGATGDLATATTVIGRLQKLVSLLPGALGGLGGLKVAQDGSAWPVTTIDGGSVALGTTADTSASSTVIGRLQKLIALLPTALGAGGGLKVDGSGTALPVSGTVTAADKSYTAPAVGELAGNTGATQMPNVACSLVRFKAEYDNVGRVYIGISTVTKADGSTDTTTGLQLSPGEDTGWIPIDNLNRFYRICDNAGDDLTYLALA
jgi:hypothetical protein